MPRVVGIDEKALQRITCRGCGSINEYAENDVRNLWSGKDYSGGSDGADGFNCAGCGKEIHVRRW